ncbi:MAG TPA: FG-GAP-like repeat-containing protein, partial [Verrucomicrobiae bacterium]|nr:FG-GAP-like repeat-containing protein [Verrucomicrobiae bacterium]
MKGLLKGILALLCLVPVARSGAPITTNSFVRHDFTLGGSVMDFAAGAWNTNGGSMIAALTLKFNSPATNIAQQKLEIVPIGADAKASGPFVLYSTTNGMGPIAIGDIDGDGANDIVFGAWTNVVIRRNTSSATAPAFDQATEIACGAPGSPTGLVLADLDGDGKLDVVYATAGVYALRNRSRPGVVEFDPPMTIHTNTATLQAGDIDGDGRTDLEVSASFGLNLIFRNTGTPGVIQFDRFSAGLSRNILTDVNGDGKPDHISPVIGPIVREPTPTTLRISINSSPPGTIAFAPGVSVQVDADYSEGMKRPRSTPAFRPDFVGADFNQDGRVDFVWANLTNRLIFLENVNLTPRQFTAWARPVEPVSPRDPFQPLVADLNGDGKVDVTVGGSFNVISVFENRIEPTPELVVEVQTQGASAEVRSVIKLTATVYAADVSAVDFFEDERLVASATAANGFAAEYQARTVGVHRITARATAGQNSGLTSKPAGLRVLDSNLGSVVGFGDGTLSQTTLLIYDSGRAFGVGSNARGQLADVFYDTPHPGFVEIPRQANAGGWKAMSAGLGFTVGLTTTGRVFSWGANDIGQLGRVTEGTTNPIPGEVRFYDGATIRKIGAGSNFTIALDANGDLFSWGGNGYGQLGKGDLADRSIASKIKKPEGVARWVDVSVGQGHVLALDDAGEIFGWGWNLWGPAGQPRTNGSILAPMLIELPPGETAWTNIRAGVVTSYAQTASGRTYLWGNYIEAEGFVSDHVPKLFEAPEGSGGFRMIGAGSPLNVALGNDNNAYVWGGGILAPSGLGDENTVTNPTRLPLPAGVSGWKTISVAARRAAALADDGRVFVWGADFTDALGRATVTEVPTEMCQPMQTCASNFPPAVKIVHPVYGDVYPADDILRFEIAADDFDGVVDFVKIFQQDPPGRLTPAVTAEVARLR